MKKKLYFDELEDFLSESAEELRMYPSDRVWLNINQQIHGEKKWPALTFGAIFTGAIMLAGLFLVQPDKDLFKPVVKSPVAKVVRATKRQPHAFSVSGQDLEVLSGTTAHRGVASREAYPASDAQPTTGTASDAFAGSETTVGSAADPTLQEAYVSGDFFETAHDELPGLTLLNDAARTSADLKPIPEISSMNHFPEPGVTSPVQERNDAAVVSRATAALSNRKASRWRTMYYLTPSISYRMLAEDKNFSASGFYNSAGAAAYSNSINNLVNQHPKAGLEGGISWLYDVAGNLRVKAGLQLNFRQYAINAYHAGMNQQAVIRMNEPGGIDSLIAYTDVSNTAGTEAIKVNSRFLQAGIPIGFEMDVLTSRKASFTIGATFQPTYNIGQQSWLLSSDYQHYVKQPELLRRWNVNAGIEAMVRFSGKGGLQWQVGPQIRYQMLPGAVRTYPVREYLVDYGLKIGVSKTWR